MSRHGLGPNLHEPEAREPVRESARRVDRLDRRRAEVAEFFGAAVGQRRGEHVGQRLERAARPHRDRHPSARAGSLDEMPGSLVEVGEEEHAEHALHEVVAGGLPGRDVGDMQAQLRHPISGPFACHLHERFREVDRVDHPADAHELGRRQRGCPVARACVEHAFAEARVRARHRRHRDRIPERVVELGEGCRGIREPL